jgi:hypothetical protein
MFLVDKTGCPTIVAGFEHGYRYKRRRDGTHEETPEKNEYSHPHDAVQYGAMVVESAGDLARAMNRVREVQAVSMAGWV